MKKFVTTVLLSILTVACMLAFTACSGDDKPKEAVTTVTEEEWEAAFALFCDEPYAEGKAPLSFVCTMLYSVSDVDIMILSVDCENDAMHFYDNSDGHEIEYYNWVGEGGKLYGSENDHVYLREFEKISETYVSFFDVYAGTYFMKESFVGKYGEFTYDEETKEYVLGENKVSFADGKISKMTALIPEETTEEGNPISYIYEYVYSAKVTVPDVLLNAPVH